MVKEMKIDIDLTEPFVWLWIALTFMFFLVSIGTILEGGWVGYAIIVNLVAIWILVVDMNRVHETVGVEK